MAGGVQQPGAYRNWIGALGALLISSLTPACASADETPRIRVGVLSSAEQPKENTSQGLYISILREAGMDAKAVSADAVRAGALNQLDVFIIGGGSGTKFNQSLGEDGGKLVEEFIRKGGGALASCAGGYSFVRGHNDALKFIEIANANCIDYVDGSWARGKGVVDIKAEGADVTVKMFYANGPLWEITDASGFGVTRALARFQTDIKKDGSAGGVMPGSPAILGGGFGNGRFVLFSAHPEFQQKLGNRPLIVDAARWVTRGPLQPDEAVDWNAVFPSSIKVREGN